MRLLLDLAKGAIDYRLARRKCFPLPAERGRTIKDALAQSEVPSSAARVHRARWRFRFSGTRPTNQSGRSQGRKPDHRYALRQPAATGPARAPDAGKTADDSGRRRTVGHLRARIVLRSQRETRLGL